MKLHLALAAVAAITSVSFLATSNAHAAEPVVAKLQTAVAEKTKVIAGGAVFLCEGDACVATGPTSRTIATASCKELVKTVGAVSTFGDARKQLNADRLDACNAVAATPTQLANR